MKADIIIDLQAIPISADGTATALKILLPGLFSISQNYNYYLAGNSESLNFFLSSNCKNVTGEAWIKKQGDIVTRIIKEFFIDHIKINRIAPKIFFAPCTLVPYGINKNITTVSVVHDLAVFKVPNIYTNIRTTYHKALFKSIKDGHVSHFICVSEATKYDLQSILNINKENITTIPHANPAPDYIRIDEEIEQYRRKLKLPPRYILFVGKLQPRKNLPRLIEAFNKISNDSINNELHLVICGKLSWMTDEIKSKLFKSPAHNRIIFANEVSNNDLLWYYRCATIFTYISLYEGFGLPILEAMSAGTPVVTSNFGAMAEIAGNAALLVDPLDVDAIANGLNALLQDETLQEKLRLEGKKRIKNYTVQNMISEYHNLFNKLMK
jgi:glycosyltransferase involved in cell wall biosynthesis